MSGPGSWRPAVFLDRDGTLNENVPDALGRPDSPRTPEQLVLVPHAAAVVRELRARGYLCLVVTNQPGLAKGTLTETALHAIHAKLERELARGGARLDGIYVCPHSERLGPAGRPELRGPCPCRKPAPGLLLRAQVEHRVDLDRSWMVGDRLSDVAAGRSARVKTILIGRPESAPDAGLLAAEPQVVVEDLAGARSAILAERAP